MNHVHGSPQRVSRVLVRGELLRALTCGSCGALYGHTPWPVATRGAVVPTSKPSNPAAAAAARAAVADAIRPLRESA